MTSAALFRLSLRHDEFVLRVEQRCMGQLALVYLFVHDNIPIATM